MQDLAHPIKKKQKQKQKTKNQHLLHLTLSPKGAFPAWMENHSGSFAKGIAMQQLDMKMQGWEES